MPAALGLASFYQLWRAQEENMLLFTFFSRGKYPFRLRWFISQSGLPCSGPAPRLVDLREALSDENSRLRQLLRSYSKVTPQARLKKLAGGILFWCSGSNRTHYAQFANEDAKPNLDNIRKDETPFGLTTMPLLLPNEATWVHDSKCIA